MKTQKKSESGRALMLARALTIATGVLSVNSPKSVSKGQPTWVIAKTVIEPDNRVAFTIRTKMPGDRRGLRMKHTIVVSMCWYMRSWRCAQIEIYMWDETQGNGGGVVQATWKDRALAYFSWKTPIPDHFFVRSATWTADRSSWHGVFDGRRDPGVLPTITLHRRHPLASVRIKH